MKKNWILHFSIVVLLFSCQEKAEDKNNSHALIPVVDSESPANRILQEKPFSNPALIYGSDFINFLAALKMTNPGNLDMLLDFTSKESIRRLGRKGVKSYFEKINLNYRKRLVSVKQSADIYYLSYEGYFTATKQNSVYKIKIENDSCKLVIE